nr:ACT domain-containing protein [Phytoactinopolyspora mesophila]
MSADGTLQVSVREVAEEDAAAPAQRAYVLSVHGGDRPGIVSAMTHAVASFAGNITDLTTRLTGDLYLVVAEVDLPADVAVESLRAELDQVARELGVDMTFRPQETDVL